MVRRFRLCGVAAIAMLLFAASASAQEAMPATPADGTVIRVRLVESPGGHVRTGTVQGALVSASEAEVTVLPQVGEAPVVLPRASIAGIEQMVRPGHRNLGALLGAAAGAVAGLIVGAAVEDQSDDDLFAASVMESGPALALLAAPVGAVIGALVAPGEQWQELPAADLRVGCGATADAGIGFSVALRF